MILRLIKWAMAQSVGLCPLSPLLNGEPLTSHEWTGVWDNSSYSCTRLKSMSAAVETHTVPGGFRTTNDGSCVSADWVNPPGRFFEVFSL